MPDCRLEYLVLLFYELGKCESGVNGATPISWQELQAWLSLSKYELEPWETKVIRDMSISYCNGVNAGRDVNSDPPFKDIRFTEQRKIAASNKLKAQREARKTQ